MFYLQSTTLRGLLSAFPRRKCMERIFQVASTGGENEPTMDRTRGALTPLAAGLRLRASESRGGCIAMSEGDWYICPQRLSDRASLREEKVCPDCPLTKNRPERDLERLLELSTISNGSTPSREQLPRCAARSTVCSSLAPHSFAALPGS